MNDRQTEQENLRRGLAYEEQIARLLESDGHVVLKTGHVFRECDMGIDLISYSPRTKYIYLCQCKNYRKNRYLPNDLTNFFGACTWFSEEFDIYENIRAVFICAIQFDAYSAKIADGLGIQRKVVAYDEYIRFDMPPNGQPLLNERTYAIANWLMENGIITEKQNKKIAKSIRSDNHLIFMNYINKYVVDEVVRRQISQLEDEISRKDCEIDKMRKTIIDNKRDDEAQQQCIKQLQQRIKQKERYFRIAIVFAIGIAIYATIVLLT